MTTVCTGFSPAGRVEYGQRFLDSFHENWPLDVGLRCYVEEPTRVPRAGMVMLWECGGIREFIERNKSIPENCGAAPVKGWRDKDYKAGYCFKFDAVKFSRQAAIPHHSAGWLKDGAALCWLDGDVVTRREVPRGFVEKLLGQHDLVYLGREGTHSEIGFWAVRLNERTRAFLADFAETYTSGRVFGLPEWHSAYVFDHCRVKAERNGLRANNLTPDGRGHVWFQCAALAAYTDHTKGKRKALGYSPEAAR